MKNLLSQRNLMIWALCWMLIMCSLPLLALGETKTTDENVSQLNPSSHNASAIIAIHYAEAIAAGKIAEWAEFDLGCLTREMRLETVTSSPPHREIADHCWQDTMAAHAELVRDEPELGIFGALGRGTGLGLIHESHRHADFWKDYPPALALSPSVVLPGPLAPLPNVTMVNTQPSRPGGLILVPGENPVEVQVVAVELLVTFPDPMTAPLALRPGEPWWASGVIRRYGPVHTLLVRFLVVSGLRQHGYTVDEAIVNEVLPDAPQLAEPGSPGILPDSPKWWDRHQASLLFEDELRQAQRLDSLTDRLEKYRRLLLLDPNHPALNAALGVDLYRAFLREGMAKGRIGATDEATLFRLVELFWNLQSQTWRQEFTEVATGHSRAADAFFAAIPALEIAVRGSAGSPEMRRNLGALYRWNNDSAAALHMHEELLNSFPRTNQALRGQLLSEIAWDRIQWLSWNRRYDHPWLAQAREEAKEALRLSESPVDKLVAAQASLIIETLSVPRDQRRLQASVQLSRSLHDQITGVTGLWSHLIGNDLVKSLLPEETHRMIPPPARSPEVVDTAVHYAIQDPNMLRSWPFDEEGVGDVPSGFTSGATGNGESDTWRIEADSIAGVPSHVVTQTAPCSEEGCVRILLADTHLFDQPDLVVRFRQLPSSGEGEAGIVLAARDMHNFHAVAINPRTGQVGVYQIYHGEVILLGTGQGTLKIGPWHTLRVQVVNSAHVDHPRLEIYVDGYEAPLPAIEALPGGGQIGLITTGDMVAHFARFQAMEMITSRPISTPAAY